jgi:hypothetical protein
MCNAANHSYSCDCGFGGDTGGGERRWGSVANFTANYSAPSFGWAKDNGGTVESYVNPNARCPVCRQPVYFYRSPYNGRVFFDDLGWPWPKHKCTDNHREPERATRNSLAAAPRPEPQWRSDGWSALLSARVSHGVERSGVRGDWDGRFVDLALPAGTKIDRESPVLIRTALPGLHEVTFLASDHSFTRPVGAVAFDRRLLPVGDEILASAARIDATALCSVGRFLLWDLDDPESAKPYLEAAFAEGSFDAAVDLLALALFSSSRSDV